MAPSTTRANFKCISLITALFIKPVVLIPQHKEMLSNRHLLEVARSLLFARHVPAQYWSDAILIAPYLINQILTRILDSRTPLIYYKDRQLSFHPPKIFRVSWNPVVYAAFSLGIQLIKRVISVVILLLGAPLYSWM